MREKSMSDYSKKANELAKETLKKRTRVSLHRDEGDRKIEHFMLKNIWNLRLFVLAKS